MRAAKALDTRTRPAIVIGVQAPDIETAVKYARMRTTSPDAIIAIPLIGGKDEPNRWNTTCIGAACSAPLIVQTVGPMSVD